MKKEGHNVVQNLYDNCLAGCDYRLDSVLAVGPENDRAREKPPKAGLKTARKNQKRGLRLGKENGGVPAAQAKNPVRPAAG